MEKICVPSRIIDARFPNQGLGDLAKAGLTDLVLDVVESAHSDEVEAFGREMRRWHKEHPGKTTLRSNYFLLHPEALAPALDSFLEKCRAKGIRFPMAWGYTLDWPTGKRAETEDLRDHIAHLWEECIRIAAKTRCKTIVLPPQAVGIGGMDPWAANRELYLSVAGCAKEHGIMILLENQCRELNGHIMRGLCSDEAGAARWVDELNETAGEERFGFSLDIGAANLCGQNLYDMAGTLGHRLKAVLIRENDGQRRASLLPFTAAYSGSSQLDWLGLVRGLRKIRFDGALLLALSDTAGALSPLLRPELLNLSKAVLDYIAWQVGMEALLEKHPSRVLFGAGNMCRAYMKCYGEKYPPLFTCDNNPKTWGTKFCGLEVKSPEKLRELSPDCAVFICNIYYREIEQQLRDMGLPNPVEYFNDEYMPSYHFERLEEIDERGDNDACTGSANAERRP